MMAARKIIPECFQSLFFTESTFGKPYMSGTTLIVPVRGVLPLKDPLVVDKTRTHVWKIEI
jgi:hypothetical protein